MLCLSESLHPQAKGAQTHTQGAEPDSDVTCFVFVKLNWMMEQNRQCYVRWCVCGGGEFSNLRPLILAQRSRATAPFVKTESQPGCSADETLVTHLTQRSDGTPEEEKTMCVFLHTHTDFRST